MGPTSKVARYIPWTAPEECADEKCKKPHFQWEDWEPEGTPQEFSTITRKTCHYRAHCHMENGIPNESLYFLGCIVREGDRSLSNPKFTITGRVFYHTLVAPEKPGAQPVQKLFDKLYTIKISQSELDDLQKRLVESILAVLSIKPLAQITFEYLQDKEILYFCLKEYKVLSDTQSTRIYDENAIEEDVLGEVPILPLM